MPTIHVSDKLMKEIKAQRNSKDEPPTITLERMLEMDTDAIEEIVRQQIQRLEINNRTGELEMR